jgi:hypothetical protein
VRFVVPPETRAALERLNPGAFVRARDKALRLFGMNWLKTAQVMSPVRKGGGTGLYLKSWFARPSGPGMLMIGNDAPYARWVEENTRKHRIFPRHKRVLAWRFGAGHVSAANAGKVFNVTAKMRLRREMGAPARGDWFFAKAVRHPGTKGQHIFRRSWEIEAPFLIEAFGDAVNAELSGTGPSAPPGAVA